MSTVRGTKLDAGDFLALASQCGFTLKEVDLSQLTRRNLVVPWTDIRGMKWYSELHLFVVARYLEAVSPQRHPWGTRAAEISLEDVSKLSEQLNSLMKSRERSQGVGEEEVSGFLFSLERYMARIDPFGPLAEFFDFVQPELRSRLRNQGRLFAELRHAATDLARHVEAITRATEGESDPMTQPMFGADADKLAPMEDLRSTQVIDHRRPEEMTAKQRVVEEAIDEVLSAVSEVEIIEDEEEEEDLRKTQVLEMAMELSEGLDEESSEPIVLEAEQEVPNDFAPESEPREEKTSEVRSLKDQLREDQKRGEDAGGADVARKIARLNRQREEFIRGQSWDQLVELYEDGIELFRDAGERQQVFLVLGTLYETKLRDSEKAFLSYGRAYEERLASQGRPKALEGVRRLGRSGELRPRYVEWLKVQVTHCNSSRERGDLQKELCGVLFSGGQHDEAFHRFSAYLAEDPNRHIDEASLEQFAGFAEKVDLDEVSAVVQGLLDENLDGAVRALVEGFRAAEVDG